MDRRTDGAQCPPKCEGASPWVLSRLQDRRALGPRSLLETPGICSQPGLVLLQLQKPGSRSALSEQGSPP